MGRAASKLAWDSGMWAGCNGVGEWGVVGCGGCGGCSWWENQGQKPGHKFWRTNGGPIALSKLQGFKLNSHASQTELKHGVGKSCVRRTWDLFWGVCMWVGQMECHNFGGQVADKSWANRNVPAPRLLKIKSNSSQAELKHLRWNNVLGAGWVGWDGVGSKLFVD